MLVKGATGNRRVRDKEASAREIPRYHMGTLIYGFSSTYINVYVKLDRNMGIFGTA